MHICKERENEEKVTCPDHRWAMLFSRWQIMIHWERIEDKWWISDSLCQWEITRYGLPIVNPWNDESSHRFHKITEISLISEIYVKHKWLNRHIRVFLVSCNRATSNTLRPRIYSTISIFLCLAVLWPSASLYPTLGNYL